MKSVEGEKKEKEKAKQKRDGEVEKLRGEQKQMTENGKKERREIK